MIPKITLQYQKKQTENTRFNTISMHTVYLLYIWTEKFLTER